MRVAERPVRHERVVEVFRVCRVSLERMELRELGLENEKQTKVSWEGLYISCRVSVYFDGGFGRLR